MAGFMDLPTELRTMIYEYCLVKEHNIVPYKEYYLPSPVRVLRIQNTLFIHKSDDADIKTINRRS